MKLDRSQTIGALPGGILLGVVFLIAGCRPLPSEVIATPFVYPSTPAVASQAPDTPAVSPSATFTVTPLPITPSPVPITETPLPPHPTLTPVVLEGNLENQIARLKTNMPRPQSEGFVVPGNVDIAAFRELATKIETGVLDQSATLAKAYGYELVQYTDRGDEYAQSYLLREEKPIQRGWGLYVFRSGAANDWIIEAPHPLFDHGTAQVALLIFRALDARALLIAGTHRDANADGSADVAHNSQTIFQAVHQALVLEGKPVVLQIHGFAADRHPGYPQVIFGSDQEATSELSTAITAAFTQAGLTVGVCDGESWVALCGGTNVQSAGMQTGAFIHLELDETVRAAPQKLIEALVGVLQTRTQTSVSSEGEAAP